MKLTFILSLLITAALTINIEKSINVADSKSINDKYQCSCYDKEGEFLYLFNKVSFNQTQFSAQVKVPSLNVTIPDMRMHKIDKFVATACAVVKTTRGNHLYAIGKKLPDNQDTYTSLIIKWDLETYDLLQYSPLGDDLDQDTFRHLVADPTNRLLFSISESKLLMLDTNCLERIDTLSDPFNNQALLSLSINTATSKVYVGTATRALASGGLFEIGYTKEGLQKKARAASLPMSNYFDVQSISPDQENNILFLSALIKFFDRGEHTMLVTLTLDITDLKSISMAPRGTFMSRGAIASNSASKKFIELVISRSGASQICEYHIVKRGLYEEMGCVDVKSGLGLQIDSSGQKVFYAYVAEKIRSNELGSSYQLQVINV
ncbi:tmk [Acrasis kona]|uniref:Tmk n=1 Tax=Acrasis kona TaxID=1008807 RepID=A0AAW2Z5F6_9EUKA